MNPTTCQNCGGPLGQFGTKEWTCPKCFVMVASVTVPVAQAQKVRWQVSQDGGKTWTDCKVGGEE